MPFLPVEGRDLSEVDQQAGVRRSNNVASKHPVLFSFNNLPRLSNLRSLAVLHYV